MTKVLFAVLFVALPVIGNAQDADPDWRPLFNRVSIMYGQNYCHDYLITNSGEEQVARLEALDFTIRFPGGDERLNDVIDVVDTKERELGVKEFCNRIARALPKVYQVK